MNFEIMSALRDLDERMPAYFRSEIFAHGGITPAIEAAEVLTALDPGKRSVRVLREVLKLYTRRDKRDNTVR